MIHSISDRAKATRPPAIRMVGRSIYACCFALASAGIAAAQAVNVDSLLQLVAHGADDTMKVVRLIEVARALRNSDPRQCEIHSREAVELAKRLGFERGRAVATRYLGTAFLNGTAYEKAIPVLEEAARLCEAVGDLTNSANAKFNLALAYDRMNDKPNAMKRYRESIAAYEAVGDLLSVAGAYTNMGLIQYDQGDYAGALSNYLSALELWEPGDDARGTADVHNNIGLVYWKLKQPEAALPYHTKSLQLRMALQDSVAIGASLNNIGLIHKDLGDAEEALRRFRESLDLATRINNAKGISDSYTNMGALLYDEGDYRGALENNLRSLEMSFEMQDTNRIAIDHNNIGSLYFALHDRQHAYEHWNKGLEAALKVGAKEHVAQSYQQMAKADSTYGDHESAYAHYRRYRIYLDSMFNEANTRKIVETEMQYAFDKQEALAKVEQEKKDALTAGELRRKKLERNGFIGGFALTLLLAGVSFRSYQRKKRDNTIITREKRRSDDLLLNILPAEVAEELKASGQARARQFDEATILFTDFKGFTAISEQLTAAELVEELNVCFKAFDNIITSKGIEKIKTIGDAYMAAGGLPDPASSSPVNVVHAALDMQDLIADRGRQREAEGKPAFTMRVGIHTGPVVAGIVGVKKFAYDIWGDTVNIASRMESSGEVGKVNISESTHARVKDSTGLAFTGRGKVEAKGKGAMEMWFVDRC